VAGTKYPQSLGEEKRKMQGGVRICLKRGQEKKRKGPVPKRLPDFQRTTKGDPGLCERNPSTATRGPECAHWGQTAGIKKKEERK